MATYPANTLLTISMITRESLRVLENELTFTKRVSRTYDDKFGIAGAKIGTTLNIRKPPRYMGRVGQALNLEAATETSVPLTLNTQRGVDIAFSSQDLALSVDDFSRRFLRPAVISVANNIDYDGTGLYSQIYNLIGIPGTIPNALLTYLDAGVRLNEEACPLDPRCLVIAPKMEATIVDALKGLFQSASQIREQYEKGLMGISAGFDWYMDQNIRSHPFGTGPVGGTVTNVSANGSVLTVTGLAGAAYGDVFTIAGVYAINPQNRQSTGSLRNFVIIGGTPGAPISPPTSITVSPALIVVGAAPPYNPYATVNAMPAAGAEITFPNTAAEQSPQGLAFFEEAFAFASADLLLPGGVDMAARVADDQLGMSIRLVRAYDINQDRFPTRLDILYGWAVLYAEMACRIAS